MRHTAGTMVENEPVDARESALAYVENHWRELTLGEARLLSVESLHDTERARSIKVMLTCR